jgi:CheY-like chemotaxis protein/anti-sigma regulatory factor (Ser/Thr protein kinase)
LLDITKIDTGGVDIQPEHFAMRDMFNRIRLTFEPNAFEKGLMLRFRGDQHHVYADPLVVERILRNLVSNAIRYTHAGGVLVAARKRGKHRLRIEVWDTGIGIAPDQLDRIFEEFYQVGNTARDRSRGIGLGLAIVRRTASILGEQVTVKSRQGRGSCFTIELPLNLVSSRQTEAPQTPSQPLAGRVIWLVEDDMLLRRAIGEMLHSWGARTRTWPDGEGLLDELPSLLSHGDDHDMPDTLITDYRLPGINGLHLVQALGVHLRSQGRKLQTLIVSGDTDPSEIARLSASGQEVLAKPFRSERLLERLNARRTTAPA